MLHGVGIAVGLAEVMYIYACHLLIFQFGYELQALFLVGTSYKLAPAEGRHEPQARASN